MFGQPSLLSNSGIKYYVVDIDEFSYFCGHAYPLRQKSEVFSKILHFHAYVKNQSKHDFQTFQRENQKEFDNQ